MTEQPRKVHSDGKVRLAQPDEIVRLRHAARGQLVIYAQEIADVVQHVLAEA